MIRSTFAALAVGAMTLALQRASALDEVCSNEIDPGPPGGSETFELQCLDGEEPYATVQCATTASGAAENVACSYLVHDPGDFCAVSVSCNVYFLNEQDEVADHVYIEEGATADSPGRWAKARVVCACPEWW